MSTSSAETFTVVAEKETWTRKIREKAVDAFPPDRLLPDRQPAYVASWTYVFGALSIGAFAVVLLSGAVLAVEGPAWWHKSSVGLFVNSLHLWSTEFFFMFMVVHLWAKFLMAAWRGRRKATWITGVIAFVVSIAAAFTGYLSQQNFDSEWIATQAKDGINSTGAGAFWNVLNFGQMLMWHIVLLPLLVALVVGLHVLLVRRRGVVPPFAPTDAQLAKVGLAPTPPATAASSPPLPDAARPLPAGQPVQREPMATQAVQDEVEQEATGGPAAGAVVSPAGGPVTNVSGAPDNPRAGRARRFRPDRDVVEWQGAYKRYDVAKEVFIAFLVVLLLVVACAVVFSSPDEHPVTVKSWSNAAPVDFAQTATAELAGTSTLATYGPPYTNAPGAGQQLGPISIERAVGVRIPIDTATDFVLKPLATLPDRPALDAALAAYKGASASRQASWDSAYESVVADATFSDGHLVVKRGPYGPVGVLISNLESMARSGALDGALLASPQLYATNYTNPLLFIADGTYLADQAGLRHLQGDQWGMMNETGNFPGQAWLWLYTMWYQVPPMNTSSNGDIEVWAIMMALTLLLALVPFIPGLRSIPRWLGVYRLIWRDHYRSLGPGILSQMPPGRWSNRR